MKHKLIPLVSLLALLVLLAALVPAALAENSVQAASNLPLIEVVNTSGDPIKFAEVHFSDSQGSVILGTGFDGTVQFWREIVGPLKLTVTCHGYQDWKKDYEEWDNSNVGPTVVVLRRIDENPSTENDAQYFPDNVFTFLVTNRQGKPLQGATVNYCGRPYITPENGIITVSARSNPTVVVSRDGYYDYDYAKDTNRTFRPHYLETIVLDNDPDDLALSSARLRKGADSSDWDDILTETTVVYMNMLFGDLYDPDCEFTIACRARGFTNSGIYELYQDDQLLCTYENKSDSDNEASFTVRRKDLKIGSKYYIVVKAKDDPNRTRKTQLHMLVQKGGNYKGSSFNVSTNGIKITVSDDIPFLGGSTYNLSLPMGCPVTVGFDDNKIWFGINWDKKSANPEEVKKGMDLINQGEEYLQKDIFRNKETMKALAQKQNEADIFGKMNVTLLGYAEGDFKEHRISGKAVVMIEFPTINLLNYNTVVWIIPVTVQIDLKAQGSAIDTIYYDFDTEEFGGSLELKGSIALNAFAGIGVSKVAGIGVYGSATLSMEAPLLPECYFKSLDLTGDLGIKAYLAWFTKTKSFAHATWNLYHTDRLESRDGTPLVSPYADFFDASQYTKADMSYVSNLSEWIGSPDRLTSRDGANHDVLLPSAYRNAQPVTITRGNDVYAAFLHSDGNDRVMTYVTKFSNGKWIEKPVIADESALMDNAPSLCMDGNGVIWMTYARTVQHNEADTMLDYALAQTIVVGTIDPDTLRFTEVKRYTPENAYAHSQELTVVNGVANLVWLESTVSSDNDVLIPPTSQVVTAKIENGTWSDSSVMSTIDRPVVEMSIADVDSELSVVCVYDADANPTTADQQARVFTSVSTDGTELGAQSGSCVRYGAIPGYLSDTYYWREGNALVGPDGVLVEVPGLTDEYEIVDNVIYYSTPSDGGANLVRMVYDSKTKAWSAPVVVLSDKRYFEDLHIAVVDGQHYVLGLYTSVTIGENDQVDDDKQLVWKAVQHCADIDLVWVDFDDDGIKPGQKFDVTLYLANVGDQPIDQIDFKRDGKFFKHMTVDLPVGTTLPVTVSIDAPENLLSEFWSVELPNQLELNTDNNTYEAEYGHPDLTVGMQSDFYNGYPAVTVYVRNEGTAPASGVLTIADPNGTVVSTSQIGSLGNDEYAIVTYTPDRTRYSGVTVFTAHLDVEQGSGERRVWNNDDSVLLYYPEYIKPESYGMVLPSGLKEVDDAAFEGDTAITTVKLLPGVTSIGSRAFADCTNLTAIEIPSTVTSIAADAFDGCRAQLLICGDVGSYAATYAIITDSPFVQK